MAVFLVTVTHNMFVIAAVMAFVSLWICEAKISEGKNTDEENGMSCFTFRWMKSYCLVLLCVL